MILQFKNYRFDIYSDNWRTAYFKILYKKDIIKNGIKYKKDGVEKGFIIRLWPYSYQWPNFLERLRWLKSEREYAKWLKYAKDHTMHLTIDKEYLERMDRPKMLRFTNLFRRYDKWNI